MNKKTLFLYIFCTVSSHFLTAQSTLKPGDVHPDAAKVDFDYCKPFQEGYAVVQKGKAYGIIDHTGKFIVPYATYSQIPDGFVNGLCRVQSTNNNYGYVDKTGKLVLPCVYSDALSFDTDGYAYVIKTMQRTDRPLESITYVIDRQGKETKVPKIYPYGELSAFIFMDDGIYDRMGKKQAPINVEIKKSHFFSEGLIAVAKQNELGETKWGFLDTKGKIAIPFQFSNEPGDFHGGHAVVIPTTSQEFDYAYINKKGETVIRVKADNKQFIYTAKPGIPLAYPFTKYGYATSYIGIKNGGDMLLDTLGTRIDFNVVVKTYAPDAGTVAIRSIDKVEVLFENSRGMGSCFVNGEHMIPPIFSILTHRDLDSHLSYAVMNVKDNKQIEGYVDEFGVFKIIKRDASQW